MTDSNPWLNMQRSTQRRIESNLDLFWITDLEGRYGLFIRSGLYENLYPICDLQGIYILKRNSERYGELFLILNSKEDWQMFYILCEDLISIANKHSDESEMLSAVEIRLKRWQKLLKQNRNQEMTLERQMGLFSELTCLKEIIIKNVSPSNAVTTWVGADFDKQDFLLDNVIIEVKSYRTSKNPVVHISSIYQLFSDKEPILLLVYELTQSDNGRSIEDLVEEINELLEKEIHQVKELFESKLIDYGYIPEIFKSPLFKFIIDKSKVYHVTENFPKISPADIKSQISDVKYSIDLEKCKDFEISKDTMNSKIRGEL